MPFSLDSSQGLLWLSAWLRDPVPRHTLARLRRVAGPAFISLVVQVATELAGDAVALTD